MGFAQNVVLGWKGKEIMREASKKALGKKGNTSILVTVALKSSHKFF